jgi:hypothetical protein
VNPSAIAKREQHLPWRLNPRTDQNGPQDLRPPVTVSMALQLFLPMRPTNAEKAILQPLLRSERMIDDLAL